ncbi:MAG TPA: hypothetical protein VGO57_05250, partial [Verrucomicrobiae bacterium]
MRTKSVCLLTTLLTTWLYLTPSAGAHNLWLEDTPEHGLTMRFAEWPDEYEVSPGHLDEVDPPIAWQIGTNGQPVYCQFKKTTDQIQLPGAEAKNIAALEAGFQVMTPEAMRAEGAPVPTNTPSRKPIFYARWQPAGAGATKPAMNLDIVPTSNPGEYQVFFRGKAVAGVKVTAYLPTGKEQSLIADEKGIVHFIADEP